MRLFRPSRLGQNLSRDHSMTDQNEELLTFRITAAVTEAVDQAIRRRYIFANIAGAAAIVLVGWLGGTSLIASQVKERVDTAVQIYDQTFRAHKERLAEVNGGFNAQIKQIDANEQKLQEELGRIRSQTDQIKLTVDDRAFIYNTLGIYKRTERSNKSTCCTCQHGRSDARYADQGRTRDKDRYRGAKHSAITAGHGKSQGI
jgi:hypothetical protein